MPVEIFSYVKLIEPDMADQAGEGSLRKNTENSRKNNATFVVVATK
jgi:hypothetical protein